MNEKYFVAAKLTWDAAVDWTIRQQEKLNKLPVGRGIHNPYAIQRVKLKKAQQQQDIAKNEFMRVAREYADFLYREGSKVSTDGK